MHRIRIFSFILSICTFGYFPKGCVLRSLNRGDIVIANIDGIPITNAEYTARLKQAFISHPSQFETFESRKRFLDGMVGQKKIVVLAQREDLQNDSDINRRVEEFRQLLLIQKFLELREHQYLVTEKDVQTYYQKYQRQFNRITWTSTQFQSLADAGKAEKLIKAGKSLEQAASIYGRNQKHMFTALIDSSTVSTQEAAVLKSLKDGQISRVISDRLHGAEIIRRNYPAPLPIESVRSQLVQIIRNEKINAEIQNAKPPIDVEVDEEALRQISLPITPINSSRESIKR